MTSRATNILIFFLIALWAVPLAAAGAAQDKKYDALLGTWDVKMEDGSREFVFEFALKDGKLTGKYTGSAGTTDMADLTYEDHTVKFNVTVGNGMVITFSAIVAEDKLTGTLSLEFGDAGITGTRRK
jgi:hypothetical protein